MSFYKASDDSLFLAKIVSKNLTSKKLTALDVGTGSGIQSKNLLNLGIKKENILAIDLNPSALNEAKKLGVKTKKSDLFEKVKQKFDLILFNPPYLPESKYDKEIDTTGGKKGDETIIRFIKNLKQHLNKNGKALLLTSSYTPNKEWKSLAKSKGFKVKKLATKGLFFEKLFIWELSLQ